MPRNMQKALISLPSTVYIRCTAIAFMAAESEALGALDILWKLQWKYSTFYRKR